MNKTIFSVLSIGVMLLSTPVLSLADQTNLREVKFLKSCTGVIIDDVQSYYIAKAKCLGLVSGYSSGHEMTVVLNNIFIKDTQPDNRFKRMRAMWCVSPETPDSARYDSVIKWYTAHPDYGNKLLADFPETNGALIVIAKSLQLAFPCK